MCMDNPSENPSENPVVDKFVAEFVQAVEADQNDPKTRLSPDLAFGCPNTRAIGVFVKAVIRNPELINDFLNEVKKVLELNETPKDKNSTLVQLVPSVTFVRMAVGLVNGFFGAQNAEKIDIEGFKGGFRAVAENDMREGNPSYLEGDSVLPGRSATNFLIGTIRHHDPNGVEGIFNAVDEILKAYFKTTSDYYNGKALFYENFVRTLVKDQTADGVVGQGRGKIKSLAFGVLDS